MKRFTLYAIGFILLVAASYLYATSQGWLENTAIEYDATEMSNLIQTNTTASEVYYSLSQTFAQQLENFGWEFGDFTSNVNFLDIYAEGDTAKVEILKDGNPFLTIFELQLPFGFTYEELLSQIQSGVDLLPADFGENSFYYLTDNLTTNILPIGDSVFAFQFNVVDFSDVYEFIAALQILN